MVTYPKVVKPWRGYPSSNTIMALRLRVNQNPPVSNDPLQGARGTTALFPNKPYHVGTIPAGSHILSASAQVKTVFDGGAAIKIGTELDDDGLLLPADLPLGALIVKDGLTGALSGITTAQTVVWAILTGAPTVGELDFVLPFYIQAD